MVAEGTAHAMMGSTFPWELLLPQLNMEAQDIQTQPLPIQSEPSSPVREMSCPSPEASKQNPGVAARPRLTCPLNGLHKFHQDRGSHIRRGELLG